MKKLYIDFDGVIMNTIEITYNEMVKLNIDLTDQESIRNYYKNLDWFVLINKSKIINDGIECIKKIIETNEYEVSILSHVTSLEEAEAKINFIRKNIKNLNFISVPRILSKTDVVDAKNNILIDDFATNLEEWKKCGGLGIRFNSELKGKGFKVINRLDQILGEN